jgi:hypothetical protein
MAVARSGFVSLDCADPVALAEFLAAMLGGEIMFSSAETVDVRTEWEWLSAMRVSDYNPDVAGGRHPQADPSRSRGDGSSSRGGGG